MRKLIYSNGSSFARQVRVLLAEKCLDYDSDVNDQLRPVNEIRPHNPALQVPVLYDGKYHLFGSDLISEYLMNSYASPGEVEEERPLASAPTRPDTHWEDSLLLGTIGELAAAVVSLRLYSTTGGGSIPFLDRQRLRIESCLDWLESRATPEGFLPGVFSLQDISLLCPLLFAEKRRIFEFRDSRWANVTQLVNQAVQRKSVQLTPVNDLP